MSEIPPKKDPNRRTMTNAELKVGKCASETRDHLGLVLDSSDIPASFCEELGIDEDTLNTYKQSNLDSLELAKDREACEREEKAVLEKEQAELIEKIMKAALEFNGLRQHINDAKQKIAEAKKKVGRKNPVIGRGEHREILKNVSLLKICLMRLDSLRPEFEAWMNSINNRPEVLKDENVIRLVVFLQKTRKKEKKR
jgi:hypothetical protein